MSAPRTTRHVSPLARSIGAATACLIVGLLVCVGVYLLRAVNFGPLSALVSFQDRLYTILAPPALKLLPAAHPVIFLDIDDEALRRWGTAGSGSGGTPRKLIAQLVSVLRDANASVIFLDFDFSSHLPDDQDLATELARHSKTPVLLPRFFGFGILPACKAPLADATPPIELDTAFDDAIREGTVSSVHAVVTLGAYGLVEGVCSSIRIRSGKDQAPRTAAMIRAVDIARAGGDAGTPGSKESLSPYMIPIRWWIQDNTELRHDQANKLAYARIKASLLVRNQGIVTTGIDLSAVDHAIVILGSTHQAAGDTHATPIGDLPGALVHANLGLELQSFPEKTVPVSIQFLLDLLLIVVSSILTIPLCWLPIYRSLPPGASITRGNRMFRLVHEGFVVAMFGALFAAVIVLLTRFFGGFLAAWRFGMLSFVLCAGIGLLIELVCAVAEAAAEMAEAITIRLSHQGTGRSRKEPPS